MRKMKSYEKIYSFLTAKRSRNETLTIEELAASAAIKKSTARVYFRNRLKGKFLIRRTDGTLEPTADIDEVDMDAFTAWMSQNTVAEPQGESQWRHLIRNANQSMIAAIEIHNKPAFQYRYQVVTILAINAWELALKAYIARYSPDVRLMKEDGTTKPFEECLRHVASELGKTMPALKDNVEVLYRYRCDFIHFYVLGIDVILFGVLHKSVGLYHRFVTRFFKSTFMAKEDCLILPLGFRKPVSPIDFLTNESVLSDAPDAVKRLVEDIIDRTERLAKQGIDELIFIPYSVATINEKRVRNADIVAAISSDKDVSIKVSHEVVLSDNPEAKRIQIDEVSIYDTVFHKRYSDVVDYCRENIPNWRLNQAFHGIMRDLKGDSNLHRTRLLDPENPTGTKKDFYSDKIFEALKHRYSAD